MEFSVAVLAGDGVGSAAMTQALNALQAVGEKLGHSFNLNEGLVGGVATDTLDEALSYEILYTVVRRAKAEFERRIVWNLA
jgi:3-isopropylmalate dehydrogenase